MATLPELAQRSLKELIRHVLASGGGGSPRPIPYGELSQRIGRTKRRLGVGMGAVLGVMGHMLKKVEDRAGGKIPFLQSLVVLKSGPFAGLPDKGMNEFWPDYPTLTIDARRKLVRKEHAKIAKFGRNWQRVLDALDVRQREEMPEASPTRRSTPRHWVMKGNPREYVWEENLRVGKVEDWHAYTVPEEMEKGDRVFFWESGSKKRIVALGEVVDPFVREDADGWVEFNVRYLTEQLRWMPNIKLLRKIPELSDASFLRPAVFGTVYPINDVEAKALYQVLRVGNPSLELWGALSSEVTLADVETAVSEGGPRLLAHVALERRNRRIIEEKKRAFQAEYGRLYCEACGIDLVKKYGAIAEGMCDVHHRKPISKAAGEVITRLSDLAILCPTCHRIVHRTNPMISVERLAEQLRGA